jgi:hypothetical protein
MVSSLERAISLTSITTMSRPTPATTAWLEFFLLQLGEDADEVAVFFLEEEYAFFIFVVWLDVDGSASVPVFHQEKTRSVDGERGILISNDSGVHSATHQ